MTLQRIRLASSLVVPRANQAEYARRHRELWPEIRAAIQEQGGHDYSIFLAPELDRVFSYVQVDDLDLWAQNDPDVQARWWAYMAEVMPTNPDSSPISAQLVEAFHQS
jgi:L-rhamnose mutarotase